MGKTTANQDSLNFTLDVTTTSGVQVPVTIKMSYPKGFGLYAVQALELLPDHREGLFLELAQRQDASTVQAMLARGFTLDEED